MNVTYNLKEKSTLENIVLGNEQNMNEIAELKFKREMSFTILITTIVITLIKILNLLIL